MTDMTLEKLNPEEATRTYHFPDGVKVVLEDVTHFKASSSTHRLRTRDGKLHIIPKEGWVHIEIEGASDFTV